MSYKKTIWEDSPSTNTPINADNLNHMEAGIETANAKLNPLSSVLFNAKNVPIGIITSTQIGAGAQTNNKEIATVFIASNVTRLESGAFSGCQNLQMVYIDNNEGAIVISSGAIPSTATIVYNGEFNAVDMMEKALININENIPSDYFNNIVVRGSDITSVPSIIQRFQKEGKTLAVYSANLFSETPSDSSTYTSNYINGLLEGKADKLKAGTGIEILSDGTINCTFADYSEVSF